MVRPVEYTVAIVYSPLRRFIAKNRNHFIFFHAGRAKLGAVINLRGIGLVGSFIDATYNVFAYAKFDAVSRPCKASADVRRHGQSCRSNELKAQERVNLALCQSLSYPLRLSPPANAVWSLDYPLTVNLMLRPCPSSLYTFRLRGLARDHHFTGFPEFEQFSSKTFALDRQRIYRVKITRRN